MPAVVERIPTTSVHFGSESFVSRGKLSAIRFLDDGVQAQWRVTTNQSSSEFKDDVLTSSQRELLDSIRNTFVRMSWERLRVELGAEEIPNKPKVFISYRKTHPEPAKAIAERLGKEGLYPWFDEWEIVPGDSLVGKIDEAFETSIAFVPVLTEDYSDGKWATAEMETAITKRISTGYRIVPWRHEASARIPPLLEPLVYVDATAHSPENFESQVAKLISGIYGLARNPYR
jgi:hypothetical protein